jgi:hypothetical protein
MARPVCFHSVLLAAVTAKENMLNNAGVKTSALFLMVHAIFFTGETFKLRVRIICVNVIDWMLRHHFRRKNLFVPSGDLQISVSAVSLQHEPMPRVLGHRKQPISIATLSFVTSYLAISLSSFASSG